MTKTKLFFKKHSSTILTVVGAGGVIATTVLAVKATPKAMRLIEEEKQSRKKYTEIFADDSSYETVILPDLTPMEIVKVAWKPYIPAVLTGISTIACIFGANHLSTKSQASLMSAYAVLDSTFKEYREKAKELYEEEADTKIKQEIVKSNFDKNIVLDEDKELFFDFQSARYFESTFEEVTQAEHIFNQHFATNGFACLNDFYEILNNPDLPVVDYGYQIGWNSLPESELEFVYEKVEVADGLECWIITMPCPPSLDYYC